jgi:hypothetical protein
MPCLNSSAAATGTIKNGVIISVRTNARPKKVRSSSSATARPSARLTITTVAVSTMVKITDERSAESVNTFL